MANQPILDNSNDPFGSFSGSVERTATSPDQVDAVLARARMRDHQALQKQLGMGAATPALGIQAPLDQDPIDEGGSMDYLGERRFPTPPMKPTPPTAFAPQFKGDVPEGVEPLFDPMSAIGNAISGAGEAVSGAIDSTVPFLDGSILHENLPPYGDSQAAIMKFIEENFPDGTMSGLVDSGQNGINGLLEQIMEIYNSNSTNEVDQMQNPGNAFDPNINANLRLPQLKAQIPQ